MGIDSLSCRRHTCFRCTKKAVELHSDTEQMLVIIIQLFVLLEFKPTTSCSAIWVTNHVKLEAIFVPHVSDHISPALFPCNVSQVEWYSPKVATTNTLAKLWDSFPKFLLHFKASLLQFGDRFPLFPIERLYF